ncbi:MAG: hypothetical protein WDM78_15585 [Puia sp.]
MADQNKTQQTALGDVAARQLAIATRTVPPNGNNQSALADQIVKLGTRGIRCLSSQ